MFGELLQRITALVGAIDQAALEPDEKIALMTAAVELFNQGRIAHMESNQGGTHHGQS